MKSGSIRNINCIDLNDIIEIEKKCFNHYIAYTPKQLRYLITKANSSCLLESFQEITRGFIIVLYKKDSYVAGVETLNVDPMHQGKGIGKKLLKAAEEEMFGKDIQRIRLEVSTGNQTAINLYERSGFRKIALLKNYYRYEHHGSHNAFRLVKLLTN